MNLYSKKQMRACLDAWGCAHVELPGGKTRTVLSFPVATHDFPVIVCSRTKLDATYGGKLYLATFHTEEQAMHAIERHDETLAKMYARNP